MSRANKAQKSTYSDQVARHFDSIIISVWWADEHVIGSS